MSKVLVSIPNVGNIHHGTLHAVRRLERDGRHDVHVVTPVAVPYENNMNRIAEFVKHGSFDWWLNIDSDNEPVRNPLDLIALNLDVVGCPYPSVKIGEPHPLFWSVFTRHPDGWRPRLHLNGNDLVEADAVGSGCMLVSTRVLSSVPAPFLREYSEQGLVVEGADFAFCRRVREAGFKVWAHYQYPARHHKTVDLYEIALAMAKAFHE